MPRLGYVAAGLCALLIVFIYLWFGSGRPSGQAPAGADPRAGASAPGGARAVSQRPPARARDTALLPEDPAEMGRATDPAEERRALWEKRLVRAQTTLDSYLEATRYPPDSRPISEHPDLGSPHSVVPVTLPLARKDEKLTDAKVTLRQDRFFLVGDERVTLTIACENSDGPVPCEVVSSVASPPPSAGPAARPEVPVPFAAGEGGALTATFQPSSQGFAGYHGTIRIALELRVDSEGGGAAFDVQYTPAAPAALTGKIREVLENGSLDLHVEMEVERAGRYVITGRADDADGKSFAYLTFNEEMGAGRGEARLRLFGKLVRDLGVRSPFRLRDVEGFLLKENTFPDRELIVALEGAVYTTKRYKDSDFSDAAWESEEKERHVKEFTKDVEDARRILDAEGP